MLIRVLNCLTIESVGIETVTAGQMATLLRAEVIKGRYSQVRIRVALLYYPAPTALLQLKRGPEQRRVVSFALIVYCL